ncbi:MAG: 50S ribosomal protein L25 [Candidatus Saelkia tenebricola]|nr:50S ribosomal protein L25 [Candidatus Saelkia tenebricola]
MEKLKIKAQKRKITGKEYAGRIRRQGVIPGVLYKKGNSVPLELKETDLVHLFHKAHSENIIVEIELIDGDEKELKVAMLKDVSRDVIKGSVIHVDFQEISLDEIVKIKVPVEIKGEAIGVKRDGGVLDHLLWEVEVECTAVQIPGKIEINVDALEIGDAIHISDLEVPQDVKLMGVPDKVVLHVVAPRKEVVEEEVLAESEETQQEPEVIREKKTEQETESQDEKNKGAETQ